MMNKTNSLHRVNAGVRESEQTRANPPTTRILSDAA